MLALVFLIFGAFISSSMLSLTQSYLEEVETYRSEVREYHARVAFGVAEKWGRSTGMFPANQDKLSSLISWELGTASNYILEDDPLNIHLPHIHYVRSSENGSVYESDRAALLISPPHLDTRETILRADQNYCGNETFQEGGSWCLNPAGVKDNTLYRSSTQASVALAVAEQEGQVRALAARVSNYLNSESSTTRSFPNTGGNTDRPIYQSVRTSTGASFNASNDCDGSQRLNWDGIPVTCRDLFSVWHVDQWGADTKDVLSDIYGIGSGDMRFHVPIKAYRNGDTLTIYVETPFHRYASGAWSSTSLRRGEQRPGGSPSYIYTQLKM